MARPLQPVAIVNMPSTALTRRQSAREQFVDTCSHRRKTKDGVTILSPDKRVKTLAEYQIRGARFNPTQLIVDSGISENDWMQLGRAISHVSSASKWWIGDFLLYGCNVYGKRTAYDLAVQATGKDRQNLRQIKVVANSFAPERRRPELSFQHHYEVCSLPPDAADELLQMAVDLGLTCQQLAELAEKHKQKKPNAEWFRLSVPVREEIYEVLLALAGHGRKQFGYFVAGILRQFLEEHGHLKTQTEKNHDSRAENVKAGLCGTCGKNPLLPGRRTCQQCSQHVKDWRRWAKNERQEPPK